MNTPAPDDTTDTLHLGHRKRLRNRFLVEGIDQFEPHQVMELLLFYALPRRDTNDIAHVLLHRFGTLSAVLEADLQDLATIPGIGEKAAAFLAMIPQITRYYLRDRACREQSPLNTPETTQKYLVPLMAGRPEEVFYLLCLDSRFRLIYPALIKRGTVNGVLVEPRLVVETALRHKAAAVILAHNHPSGHLTPSAQDVQFTRLIQQTMIPIGIQVIDHIIVADETIFSFVQNRLLSSGAE
ncbi:MAG: DNA repair protein RadC [Magnetococcales bacterium]|nr:DNA repair protein RadC [Magnetococcales bacterium]